MKFHYGIKGYAGSEHKIGNRTFPAEVIMQKGIRILNFHPVINEILTCSSFSSSYSINRIGKHMFRYWLLQKRSNTFYCFLIGQCTFVLSYIKSTLMVKKKEIQNQNLIT